MLALETGESQALFSCFAASTNKFYIISWCNVIGKYRGSEPAYNSNCSCKCQCYTRRRYSLSCIEKQLIAE